MQENVTDLGADDDEYLEVEDYDDEIYDDDTGGNDDDYEENDFDKDHDKIIEQGQRQKGM